MRSDREATKSNSQNFEPQQLLTRSYDFAMQEVPMYGE